MALLYPGLHPLHSKCCKGCTVKEQYLTKTHRLRVHRRDGSCKLLLGQVGFLPKIGSIVTIKIGPNEAVLAKITAHPHANDNAVEAREVEANMTKDVVRLIAK